MDFSERCASEGLTVFGAEPVDVTGQEDGGEVFFFGVQWQVQQGYALPVRHCRQKHSSEYQPAEKIADAKTRPASLISRGFHG
jgi:hypothetical protein